MNAALAVFLLITAIVAIYNLIWVVNEALSER